MAKEPTMAGPDGIQTSLPETRDLAEREPMVVEGEIVMASPGFGKYAIPGEAPRRAGDFAHLPPAARYLAELLDALPEGAAMGVKAIARLQTRHGQAAVATAFRTLHAAGHLFRYRYRLPGAKTRWTQLTYFSRTPRPPATERPWWNQIFDTRETGILTNWAQAKPEEAAAALKARNKLPAQATAPAREFEDGFEPVPLTAAARHTAYRVLTRLGDHDPRLRLTERECRSLTPLAAQWIARGTTETALTRALTTTLPAHIGNPGALTRHRLRHNMPPVPQHLRNQQRAHGETHQLATTGPAPARQPAAPPRPRPPAGPPPHPDSCDRCTRVPPRLHRHGAFLLRATCHPDHTDRDHPADQTPTAKTPAKTTATEDALSPATRHQLAAALGQLLHRVEDA
jgi:hypothetical protein